MGAPSRRGGTCHDLVSTSAAVPRLPRVEISVISSALLDVTEALKVEAEHFVDCVSTRSTPESNGAAGLRIVRILEVARVSLANHGTPVDIRFADPISASDARCVAGGPRSDGSTAFRSISVQNLSQRCDRSRSMLVAVGRMADPTACERRRRSNGADSQRRSGTAGRRGVTGIMCSHRERPYAGSHHLPEREAARVRHIVLPLGPGMTQSDVERVATALANATQARGSAPAGT
jgi:hypothetical protein